jgi:hypothetical protein
MRRPGWHGIAWVLVVAGALMGGALLPAFAQDVRYVGPAGAPACDFPGAKRPVADIVSPTRSNEKRRDATTKRASWCA